MPGFRKITDLLRQPLSKRMVLLDEQRILASDFALLKICADALLMGENIYAIDASRQLLKNAGKLNFTSSIVHALQPKTWSECHRVVIEQTEDSSCEAKKPLLILDDWQALSWLFEAEGKHRSPAQLLFEFKIFADEFDVLLVVRYPQLLGSETINELLAWSTHRAQTEGNCINLIPNTPEATSLDGQILFNNKEELALASNKFSNGQVKENPKISLQAQSPKNKIYTELVRQLSMANDRDDLLETRRQIQTHSTNLDNDEKVSLSEIYKIHLQRVKLLEQQAETY